jgi:uncharacterized membrane protein
LCDNLASMRALQALKRVLPVLLLRLSLLVAIAASAVLVVDYANAGDPAFCGVQSGCFAVRVSSYSKLMGVPLPWVGLLGNAALFAWAMLARKRVQHAAVAVAAVLGAAFAVRLLMLQAWEIKAYCPWCVAVDVSAVLAAISAVATYFTARRLGDDEPILPPSGRVAWAWTGAAMAAVVVPLIWGKYPISPPPPPQVQEAQVPGKLTIFGFTDFECPFCRRLHPELEKAAAEHPGRIAIVRHMMPLPSHPGAEPAALAYLCAPDDKKDAVADKLYEAEPLLLTTDGVLGIAEGAGVDREKLAACMKAPATRARLLADVKLFDELGGRGLPFTFVGRRVVLGFNPERLQMAVESELSGSHFGLPVWGMFVLLGAIFGATGVVTVVTAAASRPAQERTEPST